MPNNSQEMNAEILRTIERLERSRRRWRAMAGSIGLAVLGLGGLAAAGVVQPSTLIQTQRLEVVDAQGRVLVSLGGDADGGSLFLFNTQGAEAVEAYADVEGRGVFRINAADGGDRLVMSSGEAGGHTTISGPDETPVLRMGTDDSGHGRIALSDAEGAAKVSLAVSETSQGGLVSVAGANESSVFEVSSDSSGRGLVHVFDETQTRSVALTADAFGGRVLTRNRAGKTVTRIGASQSGQGELSVTEGPDVLAVLRADDQGGQFALSAPGNQPRISMTVNQENAGQLSILNRAGMPVFDAFSDASERGVVLVADELGQRRVTFQVDEDGGALFLLNSSDHGVVEMYANDQGDGFFLISDRFRSPRVSVGSDSVGGALELWDASPSTRPTVRVTPE